ncbi:hypothetical protein MUP59_06645, partial [Candidatus Bathyarchaeota archaeon]|nr:hypothetical protein [Candidatus Bathyarchaeota archaeon]
VIRNDYSVDVEYDSSLIVNQEVFAREQANLDLGIAGNPDERVDSPRPVEQFLTELDQGFKKDMGFGLRNTVNVLQVLSLWSGYTGVKENPYYCSDINKIKEVCSQNLLGIDQSEIYQIVNFLVLSSYDIVRGLGEDTPCRDLPIWEHRKRYSRYTLRPLILVDGEYYWGPYSTMKSGMLWCGSLSSGILPVDLQSPTIENVIDAERKLVEDALVDKALDIVKRRTSCARKELPTQA